MVSFNITLTDEKNILLLRNWRIQLASPEGAIPSWDFVMDELIKRAQLEDQLG